MRRVRIFTISIGAVLCLTACAMLQSRESLRTARDTYNTTLSALTTLRAQGLLSPEAVERIEAARIVAWAALDAWQAALETGQSPDGAIADYTEAMQVLVEERLRGAEGGGG